MKLLLLTTLISICNLLTFGQTVRELEAAKNKVDLNDINGLLTKSPFWSLSEAYIGGKGNTDDRDSERIFSPNGYYLEYSNNEVREGLWSCDKQLRTLVIELYNSKDTFQIKTLDQNELVLEKKNGDRYSLSSEQLIQQASYYLTRRLEQPLSIENLKKDWEEKNKEKVARELTILECSEFNNGLAMICTAIDERKKHCGYINEKGEFAIKPSFEEAFDFKDGFALVKLYSNRDEYIFIDVNGANAFDKKFEEARSFNEGIAAVRKDGDAWGFINVKGEYISKSRYEQVDDFNDGVARVMQENKWGYIDTNGDEIILPQFTCANNFSEGLALVGQFVHYHYTQYSFIDKAGKVAFKVNREETEVRINCCPSDYNPRTAKQYHMERGMFKDGSVIVTSGPPYESFIFNKEGKKNRASQDDIHRFNEGLAVAQKPVGKKYGYIDNKGSWIVDPIFDGAGDFSEGLAAVSINDNWGFIDKSGKVIINKDILNAKTSIQTTAPFELVSDFSEGLAVVVVRGKYGFINKEGKWIVKPELVSGSPFKNGKACVLFEDRSGWNFIDKNGTILFPKFK